jgi:hypothetical protein
VFVLFLNEKLWQTQNPLALGHSYGHRTNEKWITLVCQTVTNYKLFVQGSQKIQNMDKSVP